MITDVSIFTKALSILDCKSQPLNFGELDALVKMLSRAIFNFSEHTKGGFKSVSQSFHGKIITTLTSLNNHLEGYQIHDTRVMGIIEKIKELHSNLFADSLIIPQKTFQIALKISFFCDVDSNDHNGATLASLVIAIDRKIPFITTRSLFRGIYIDEEEEGRDKTEQLISLVESCLFNKHFIWDIFLDYEGDKEGEFLLFLPKSLLPGRLPYEKLQELDFIADGTVLRKISFLQALRRPRGKANLNSFFRLFADTATVDKLFNLSGHGDHLLVGGLKINHYRQFLDFMEKQRCRALAISSCYAAGGSSLFSLASTEQQPRKFLMIVRSIGDLSMETGYETDFEIDKYFDELGTHLQERSSTLVSLRLMTEKVEKNKTKGAKALMRVCFPHHSSAPIGFRPLGESGSGFSVTYQLIKQKELAASGVLPGTHKKKATICLWKKKYLQLHPMIMNITLVWYELDPRILSMIPGQASHFIKEILLTNGSFKKLIDKTIKFHKKGEVHTHKAFFIGRIHAQYRTVTEVVLLITPSGSFCSYRENDEYFRTDGKNISSISLYRHLRIFKLAVKLSRPSLQAINISSQGQETYEQLSKILMGKQFWGPEPHQMINQIMLSCDLEAFKDFGGDLHCFREDDKGVLVHELLERGEHDLALEFFLKEEVNPNSVDIQNRPLLHCAIIQNHISLFRELLRHGCNVDSLNPKDYENVALHYAVEKAASHGNAEYLTGLLSNYFMKVDVTMQNTWGLSPMVFAAKYPHLIRMFERNGATLNYRDKHGCTPLGIMVRHARDEIIQPMLDAGANPNLGDPSPLILAIYYDRIDLVEKFMFYGGKPFEMHESGRIPFIESAGSGSLEILNYFLEITNCQLDVEDALGMTPLIAAMRASDYEKLDALQRKGAKFRSVMSYKSIDIFVDYLHRLTVLGEHVVLKQFLSRNNLIEDHVKTIVVEYLRVNNPNMLNELIVEGLVS